MLITDYKGKDLLNPQIVEQIQKQSDLILKNKDAAGAYKSALHLKSEISKLNPEEIRQVFPKYRRITSCLKTLALPLLDIEDIEHLLKNNLDYLDTLSEQYLVQGLAAKIASGPDEEQDDLKKRFLSAIPKDSGLYGKISFVIASPELAEGRSNPMFIAINAGLPRQPEYGLPRNDTDGGEFADDLKDAQNKAKEMSSRTSRENSEEEIARQIYSQSGTRESEEAFGRRAQALVKSRLHDVRAKADLSEYLSMAFETGGLGLSEESLSGAQKIIEDGYNRVHGAFLRNKQAESLNESIISRPVSNSVIASPATAGRSNPVVHPDEDQIAAGLLRGRMPPRNDKAAEQAQKELDSIIKGDSVKDIGIEEILKSKPAQRERRMASPGKVRLDDIKQSAASQSASPKSYGLSDEFQTLTLSDFRSLGGAESAQEKILSKIKTLEQESIAHKMAGIRSFRSSPLYKQYVSIGEKSLESGKKLSEAMADPLVNPEKMEQDEFFAIADLNGKLK